MTKEFILLRRREADSTTHPKLDNSGKQVILSLEEIEYSRTIHNIATHKSTNGVVVTDELLEKNE
jgi:hypothetical protein